MATTNFEEEVQDLRVKNTELVQKMQFWKMKSAQLERDNLDLMKENNNLRIKVSRLRSGGAAQARALDTALQTSSEEAITFLVQASTAVARTLELSKTYMREQEDLIATSPRWSTLGGTPIKEKVNKVAPMLMGGRSIQPYVTLDRINLSNPNLSAGNSNRNRNVTERVLPLPMHILHDVYIPLERIDPSEFRHSLGVSQDDTDPEDNGLDENNEEETEMNEDIADETPENVTDREDRDFDNSRQLNVVHEDSEPEDTQETPPQRRYSSDNPMEGPSWLLDLPRQKIGDRGPLEPDSTTEPEGGSPPRDDGDDAKENTPQESLSFTPTVRRRKRSASPPAPSLAPHLTAIRNSLKNRNSGRELKVILPKMEWCSPGLRLEWCTPSPRPSKRRVSFEAPSPSGATDSALTVMEQISLPPSPVGRQERAADNSLAGSLAGSLGSLHGSLVGSLEGGDSESWGEVGGRTRRPRKQVTYREKPLNRKLRR